MEEIKRGVMNDANTKKDKKRSNIASRLSKLELTFRNDRDIFYRNSLHDLQNKLATLQQGTNEEYLYKKTELEETRDYELTKLRLWEEYQVKRIELEYNEDILKAKNNHDNMIKLIKDKLYDKLQKQIKELKEEKFLLNVVNGNSWSQGNDSGPSIPTVGLNLNDRRSLRKRGEYFGKLVNNNGSIDEDLSDGNQSSTNNQANGYLSSGKRRRVYTSTKYSSNDELSTSNASAIPHIQNLHKQHNNGSISSGYESNLSDKDYDALNILIMENEDGGKSLDFNHSLINSHKVQTRGAHKQFIGPQGLKQEELNEDLTILRNSAFKNER